MDDFFEDDIFDPENDIQEDMAEEAGIFEDSDFEESDSLIDESANQDPEANHNVFDVGDAILFGTFAGLAYDSAIDEKQRKKLLEQQDKDK